MELRVEAAHITGEKRLKSRWMPSHQDIARARDERERLDIKMNDLADRLAKKGTQLPVPLGIPKEPWSIFVAGGEAPTLSECLFFFDSFHAMPARGHAPRH